MWIWTHHERRLTVCRCDGLSDSLCDSRTGRVAYINPHDDTICGVVTVVVFGYNFWYNFACCVALIYNISCARVCVIVCVCSRACVRLPKNEAKKKIV